MLKQISNRWMILIGLLILMMGTAVFWQSNARAQERGDPDPTATAKTVQPPQLEPQTPTADCASDDSYEDNDSIATAALVTPGSYGPLIVCDTDKYDYFAVNVPAGHTLQVELIFSDSGGDIDLYLYNQNGDSVTSSISATDNEAVQMTVARGDVYYILNRVFQFSGSNNYSMKLSFTCQDCITYQGQLTASGAPANGDYQFQFRLYDGTGSGAQMKAGPITRTVPVTNGIFTTDLYFGETAATYNGADFNGSTYLDIQVRSAGSSDAFTTLAPRQPLTAAPTAHTLQPGALISGSVVNNAVLTLNNDSAAGLAINSAGGDGVFIDSASDDGVFISSTGGDGVAIDSAGDDGVVINSASTDGFEIGSTGYDGVAIHSAGNDGVFISSASDDGVDIGSTGGNGVAIDSAGGIGVYVNSTDYHGVMVSSANNDGVAVSSAGGDGVSIGLADGNGVDIGWAGGDGLWVCRTGSETSCSTSAYNHGVEIGNAQNDGIHVIQAGDDGVEIGSVGNDGVEIGSANFDGVSVGSAGDDGLQIDDASDAGVYVNSAGGYGMFISSAGNDGLRVCTTGSEISCSSNPYNHGVEIGNAQNDGLHVIQAGGDGVEVCATGTQSGCYANPNDHGVEVGNAEDDGFHVTLAGQDGLDIVDAGADGVQVRNATNYAGDFDGNVSISGSCTGCATAVMGINRSDQTLQPGALVAPQGTQDGSAYDQPFLVEATTAVAGQSVIGVVQGRAELVESDRDDGTTETELVPRDEAAQPGDYVTIIIYGPAQVKATTTQPIAAGERLTVDENGLARPLQTTMVNDIQVAEDAPTVGIALDAKPNDDGMIWILVNPQ